MYILGGICENNLDASGHPYKIKVVVYLTHMKAISIVDALYHSRENINRWNGISKEMKSKVRK